MDIICIMVYPLKNPFIGNFKTPIVQICLQYCVSGYICIEEKNNSDIHGYRKKVFVLWYLINYESHWMKPGSHAAQTSKDWKTVRNIC